MQYAKESVRKAILDSALQEFYEKGYEEASMRSIAEGAGTSLGNLYRYFRGKEDLYLNAVFPALDEGIAGIGKIFDVSDQALSFTAQQMVEFIRLHHREYTVIAKGPACHYAAFQEKFTECIATKLQAHSSALSTVLSPRFCHCLASAFCSGLREILERPDEPDRTCRNVLELMRYLFEDFDTRAGALRKEAPHDPQ